jgi:hypothetical protein
VKAFSILLISDMLQGADNSGFMRHNAYIGCRACFCKNPDRGNLEFDVVIEGRYYFDIVYFREEGQDLEGREKD